MERLKDRKQAAELLAESLAPYRGQNPLILAIPRGAVPMGKILADRLEGQLDVVLVHKLGAPGHEELAIGSIDEGGHVYLHPYAAQLQIPDAYLQQEQARQLEVLRARRAQYSPDRPPIDPKDRIVIIVDDGVATGSTMMAALQMIRDKGPKKLIAAVGVAPPETARRLEEIADEVVCVLSPPDFHAVSQFFESFFQVSDEEVMEILAENSPASR